MGDVAFSVGQLRALIERIESVQAEIKDLNSDKSSIFKEAQSAGFDVKVMKVLIAERKKGEDELKEHSELLRIYRDALEPGTPIATRAPAREGVE